MKQLFILLSCLLIVAIAVWMVGCGKDNSTTTTPTSPTNVGSSSPVHNPLIPLGVNGPSKPNQGQNGTTLTDAITATCFNYYDWSCSNPLIGNPDSCFKRGDCQDVTASVTVTKGAQHIGYNVSITVTNGGDSATIDLKVGGVLEYHATGGYVPSTCKVTGLESQHPVLAAHESYTYTGVLNVSSGCLISDNGSYRINTDGYVTITNHSGSLGVPTGPNGKTDSAPLCTVSNNCINVTNIPGIPLSALPAQDPTSFTITVTSTNPVNVCASGTVTFTIHICATSTMPFLETWTLDDPMFLDGVQLPCTPTSDLASCKPPYDGCTFTQGFWKTHGCVGPNGKSQYGHNPDLITPLLTGHPITMGALVIDNCEKAGWVFQAAQGNNGIMKLYSQMLAALLNKANGADPSCLSQTISDANTVLLAADPNGDGSGWTGISGPNRTAVINAHGVFAAYNQGTLCAPTCE